jgi:aryl-alcohol dehydrogenase-like predicted oxidoreductase
LRKYKLICDDFGGWSLHQQLLATLKIIADKHRVGIAEIACKYILDKSQVKGVIIGARNTNHLKNILSVNTVELDDTDTSAIRQIILKAEGPAGSVFELERDKDGKHGSIMKYTLQKKPG